MGATKIVKRDCTRTEEIGTLHSAINAFQRGPSYRQQREPPHVALRVSSRAFTFVVNCTSNVIKI